MNRPETSNLLPLWIILLVVPILVLAIYLQFADAGTQSKGAPRDEHSIGGDRAVTTHLKAITKTVVVDAPILVGTQKPDEEPVQDMASAVSLDPETARAAVQQVENSVYERAIAIFEREPVDIAWASTYEQSLRDMFALHQGLQRVSINSISCHTSMCRVEVFTPRDADADFFTAMFYDGLATFNGGELNAEAAITRRMERGITSVYVARKDYTLGFY